MSDDRETARLLSRAVRETLDTLVAPTVRNALIHDALKVGGLSAIPGDPEQIRAFIHGPFRDTTAQALGEAMAASITDEIDRVVDNAKRAWTPRRKSTVPQGSLRPSTAPQRTPSSQFPAMRRSLTPIPTMRRSMTPTPRAPVAHSYIRRQGQSQAPTGASVPPTPSEYFRHVVRSLDDSAPSAQPVAPPRVLVATRDSELLSKLSDWLHGKAQVLLVRSVFALLKHVEDATGSLVIVLDGKQPSIRPTALAALADELSPAHVVLCRGNQETTRSAFRVSPSVSRWITFDDPMPLEEVAAHCKKLVS